MSHVLDFLFQLGSDLLIWLTDYQFWKKKKNRRKFEEENELPKRPLFHPILKVLVYGFIIVISIKLVVGLIYISERHELETKREMNEIENLLQDNKAYLGKFPEELTMIIRNNPLRKHITLDAWGNEYHYEVLSKGLNYKLVSKGKDGLLGTDDDIGS